MKLVDQNLFGEYNGNCLVACLATLTGIPLADIPNFCVEYGDREWYVPMARFLNGRGLSPVSFNFADGGANHLAWAADIAPHAPWIAAGPTSRGKHAVVYVGGKLFHDPNPRHGRAGLLSIEDATYIVRNVENS